MMSSRPDELPRELPHDLPPPPMADDESASEFDGRVDADGLLERDRLMRAARRTEPYVADDADESDIDLGDDCM